MLFAWWRGQRIDEDEYGGTQALMGEGLPPSIGLFLVNSSLIRGLVGSCFLYLWHVISIVEQWLPTGLVCSISLLIAAKSCVRAVFLDNYVHSLWDAIAMICNPYSWRPCSFAAHKAHMGMLEAPSEVLT